MGPHRSNKPLDIVFLVLFGLLRRKGAVPAHATSSFPDELLERLRVLADRMTLYFETCEGHELDPKRMRIDAQAFRRILGQCISNPILLRSPEGMDVISAAARSRLNGRSGSWKPLIESHRRILEALEARDPAAARAAVSQHIRSLEVIATSIPDIT